MATELGRTAPGSGRSGGSGRPGAVGDLLTLDVGAPVHGGHCLARHDGRIVFVRHALPGERVRAVLTEARRKGYWRADATEVLVPSPDRVESVWRAAGPGGVGGGELGHVSLPGQLAWKRDVIADALRRIGHLPPEHPALARLHVERPPGDAARRGLHTRTRIELVADGEGRAGMHRYRSHEVLALTDMPLALAPIVAADLFGRTWRPGATIEAVAPADGDVLVLVDGEPLRGDRRNVRERVRLADGSEYRYRVAGSGFWQTHVDAPAILVDAVLDAAAVGPGAAVWDLYSGAGLFTVPLAEAVGSQGRVDAVEGDERAVTDARRNVHGLDQVVLHGGDVAAVLDADSGPAGTHSPARPGRPARPDVVVLDPPRAGAGGDVMDAVLAAAPERVVYVACDPAALARDVAHARERGHELSFLRAFDLFPHTHHVECVAVLTRTTT
ncbi:class I SAM-dependent RNA methyltransferase [Occultella glacieicola]|uniref:Class I SAM-dependent RNA methyltransferase n=1 Tax=Occultella glacieicola TaxID=2518684 RepID=A0ABY2DZY4_9MICO|nr:TRAM domain-containing protein [Occultella glacieicola]TDE88923.1 class I SAM-dependent RNA methyltransferase [Occultella glacieicola]